MGATVKVEDGLELRRGLRPSGAASYSGPHTQQSYGQLEPETLVKYMRGFLNMNLLRPLQRYSVTSSKHMEEFLKRGFIKNIRQNNFLYFFLLFR